MQQVRAILYLAAIGLFFVIGQKLLGQANNVAGKTWGLLK